MQNEVRIDPVTGFRSVHPDQRGKPTSGNQRILTPDPDPCPFCRMAADIRAGAVEVYDGAAIRPVLDVTERVFAVPNRWGIFGDEHAELVLPLHHVADVESTDVDTMVDLLTVVARRWELMEERDLAALGFINVGVQAGGSLRHLHAQVVGSTVGRSEMGNRLARGIGRHEDVDNARRHDLVLVEVPRGLAYLTATPVCAGEVRIVADDLRTAAELIWRLNAAAASVASWSYNLILSFPRPDDGAPAGGVLVQWLPRFDLGIVFPYFFDTAISSIDLSGYAVSMRDALARLPL